MEQPDEFKELQTLLRLKRYEQPPAGYEDRFLKEYHRRQRWEAGRVRGLAALAEKFGDWLSTFTVPKYAYAGTFGLFLAVAAALTGVGGKSVDAGKNVASIAPLPPAVEARATFALNQPLDLSDLNVQAQIAAGQNFSSGENHPRYILDTRPASYEEPFSF